MSGKTTASSVLVVCCAITLIISASAGEVIAQDGDSSSAYIDAVSYIEKFNAIQREIGVPEISVPDYAEWLEIKRQAEAGTQNLGASDANKESLERWINKGIKTSGETAQTVESLQESRRQRLWAKSRDLLVAQRQELNEAREWAELNGFAENSLLPEGGVIGLTGIRNGVPKYNVTYNAGAADTISADEVWPGGGSGLDITGSGALLGLWDGGDVLTNHYEFTFGGAQSRAIDQDGVSSLPVDLHPTAVAGTMAAAGVAYSGSPRGTAYQSELWTYDWYEDLASEMNSAYANDLRVSNHSYGEQAGWGYVTISGGIVTNCWWGDLAVSPNESHYFGEYDEDVTNTDAIAYGNPYSLPIWAAGNERDDAAPTDGRMYVTFSNTAAIWHNAPRPNDYYESGYDTITDHGVAKNVLTVGATYKIAGGYSGASSVSVAPFSGFGPTDDGRIKPDVVAAGVDLTTPVRNPADPDNPYYYVLSSGDTNNPSYATGTSFSSPSAAGSIGLMVDLREDLAPGEPYWSSTLKAITIHSADDAENVGPDYRTGWGLMNAENATLLIQQDYDDGGKQYIKEVMLNDGDYIEFPVTATGGVPLKVSMVWTDPAGAMPPEGLDPTNIVLVNDLDLRVISSAAETNCPWVLDPDSPSADATTGDNCRDNVEQVVVTNASALAEYTVRITHKNQLLDDTGTSSAQAVSIVVSGIIPETRTDTRISKVQAGVDDNVGWASVVGQNYRIQTAMDVCDNSWSNISAEISATKTNTVWVSDDPSDDVRFYRLLETN